LNYFRHQNAAIHLLSVGNWELGIGNWDWASGIGHRELGIGETGNSGLGIGHELSSKKVKLKITPFIFLLLHYQFPITNALFAQYPVCPIPDYPLPNLSWRTAASVWLTKS
jgi:hypothetical protein